MFSAVPDFPCIMRSGYLGAWRLISLDTWDLVWWPGIRAPCIGSAVSFGLPGKSLLFSFWVALFGPFLYGVPSNKFEMGVPHLESGTETQCSVKRPSLDLSDGHSVYKWLCILPHTPQAYPDFWFLFFSLRFQTPQSLLASGTPMLTGEGFL